jgi:hypothetical protein
VLDAPRAEGFQPHDSEATFAIDPAVAARFGEPGVYGLLYAIPRRLQRRTSIPVSCEPRDLYRRARGCRAPPRLAPTSRRGCSAVAVTGLDKPHTRHYFRLGDDPSRAAGKRPTNPFEFRCRHFGGLAFITG